MSMPNSPGISLSCLKPSSGRPSATRGTKGTPSGVCTIRGRIAERMPRRSTVCDYRLLQKTVARCVVREPESPGAIHHLRGGQDGPHAAAGHQHRVGDAAGRDPAAVHVVGFSPSGCRRPLRNFSLSSFATRWPLWASGGRPLCRDGSAISHSTLRAAAWVMEPARRSTSNVSSLEGHHQAVRQ
jgi:hypothetical protein